MSKPAMSAAIHWIEMSTDRMFALGSRIHPLPSDEGGRIFLKRDDELSSGISGSKLRKYASLLPSLQSAGIEEVALIGGPHSNNLIGLLQLLKERRIRPWLFVREAGDAEALRGNALLLKLLAPPGSIQWIPKREWAEVESAAATFLSRRSAASKACVIAEGALDCRSLAGAATLALEILRYEESEGRRFGRIFVDSGTGMSASGLVLGMAILDERPTDRCIHITLIAGDECGFRRNLRRFQSWLETEVGLAAGRLPELQFHRPPLCPAFGATRPSLFRAAVEIAQSEGLLMEPIYSVKHYLSMRQVLDTLPDHGPALFVYSGGSLGLMGFQEQLAAVAQSQSEA